MLRRYWEVQAESKRAIVDFRLLAAELGKPRRRQIEHFRLLAAGLDKSNQVQASILDSRVLATELGKSRQVKTGNLGFQASGSWAWQV